MTDIAIREQQQAVQAYQQSSIDRLQKWAEQAVVVREIAEEICSTSFAPTAYRGKPNEATAAILAGAELGLDPMASLRAFDSIQGTPAPKAITLRAVAQAAGHEIRVAESTPRRCIVEGRRRGDTDWQRAEWTIERAESMPQYKSNPNWRTSPAQMLVARATAEVCRWIASDAIMGMPYAAEEIADSTGTQGTAPTRKVTAADIVGQAVEHATECPRQAIPQQLDDIVELLRDRGIDTSKQKAGIDRVIGRHVDELEELTFEEAEQVIASLTLSQDQP